MYWSYYLLSFLLAYATQHPAAAVLALGFWLCRGFLPDPVVWLRTFGKIRRLRAQIDLNPSNMTACRELARIYVERKRPRKAIALIEKTRERMADSRRHPQGSRDDAELLHLLGLARLRAGDPAGALDPLVAAVAIAPDVGRGDPYMIAAQALAQLGRWAEAEDALDRYVDQNQSTIRAYVLLARARAKQKNADGANDAIREARATWNVLPGFKRRHEWAWYLAALCAFVWL